MHLGLSYLTPRGFQDSEGGLCSWEWNDSCEELVVNHRLLTWQRDRYRNSDKVRFLVSCQIYGYFFGLPFSIFYLDFILSKRRWKKCRIWSTSMFRGIALAQRWRKARRRGGFKRIPVVSIWHVRERLAANPPQGRDADAGSLLIRFVKDFSSVQIAALFSSLICFAFDFTRHAANLYLPVVLNVCLLKYIQRACHHSYQWFVMFLAHQSVKAKVKPRIPGFLMQWNFFCGSAERNFLVKRGCVRICVSLSFWETLNFRPRSGSFWFPAVLYLFDLCEWVLMHSHGANQHPVEGRGELGPAAPHRGASTPRAGWLLLSKKGV